MTQYTVVKTFKTFRHSLYHRSPEQVLDIICDDLGDHKLTDLTKPLIAIKITSFVILPLRLSLNKRFFSFVDIAQR